MAFLQRIPRTLRWILSVVLILLALMTLFRLGFYWKYNPPGKAFSGSAFILGLRYDARIACIAGVVMLLLCAIPFLNPFRNPKASTFWNILLPLAMLVLVIVYAADYYHFDYLHQRLNATVLNYLQDAQISFGMMWQTYPLVKISIGIIILLILSAWFFKKLLSRYRQKLPSPRKMIGAYILVFLLFGFCIVGRVIYKTGQFPLRWSDAYSLSDDFKANLALNPFQSFFSSLKFRNSGFNIKEVKAGYPLMSAYLGVQQPDSAKLTFDRFTSFPQGNTPPNVVLVICESFSAYKSSMYGNPLNTTPFFNELCSQGVFFDRCFTPSYGTARGVWATVTGVPDVESPKTASRNPNAVDQQCIINSFSGLSKYYFLGGSAAWANIRGLLTNNISGLQLYEQEKYKAQTIDVWGISDKNLFLEANNVLKQETKPFFAVIQTADNHRPYTIPTEDLTEFKKVSIPQDSLLRYGFENNDELNAFRYTDFCFRKFMEAAKKEKYFSNTLFVFVGDHGIKGNAGDMFPRSWTQQSLTSEHVPLLFYAPGLLQPRRVSTVCSQLDVLPSIAGVTRTSFRNTAMGRNLFDSSHNEHFAFIFDPDLATIGLVGEQYYYIRNLKSGKKELVSVTGNEPLIPGPQSDSARNRYESLTNAWYETAKYLLLNNKKQ